jgi:Bacterial regulatory helix-turn-helix protein, lysR family
VARLRALVTVADGGSVREAARRLTVTESAVSAALSALAREVRVPLVEREGRGVRLTASGRAYAGYARTILACTRRGSPPPAATATPGAAGCGSPRSARRRPWHAVTHGSQPGATALLVRHLLDREGWRPAQQSAKPGTVPARDRGTRRARSGSLSF